MGFLISNAVGDDVALTVGLQDGSTVGKDSGNTVGNEVGYFVGLAVGFFVSVSNRMKSYTFTMKEGSEAAQHYKSAPDPIPN